MSKIENYIPLEKYWLIRMGVLDIVHGKNDISKFLEKQKDIGGDLLALKRASKGWDKKSINVGECGTLYRYLQFASWKLNLNKKFIKEGTLKKRKVSDNPKIVNWSLQDLLKLDGGTSQWASAAILLGNQEKIKNPSFFLKKTLKALKHWQQRRKEGKQWDAQYDEVILRQANYFLKVLRGRKAKFKPNNPDDYCFARAFGIVDKAYGEKHWPMLKHHESNRLEEMEKALKQAEAGKRVTSKDHRVVQAIAMWAAVNHRKIKVQYPKAVNKSWPQFWKFLDEYKK